MITAGCSIGAGMFSLPVVSSGMWFLYSVMCLVFLWYVNYLASLYLLEANMHFEPGVSFDSISKKLLGKTWNALIGISIAFLLYILLYAFHSAFGNMAVQILQLDSGNSSEFTQGLFSLILGSILAFFIWLSTNAVGRVASVLVFGMVIAFVISMSGLSLSMKISNLFPAIESNGNKVKYLWATLPYYMTSFGYSAVVPSLYKYYGYDSHTIKKGLLGGSLTALIFYTLFLLITFGNISRPEFQEINAIGGNIGHLINAFGDGESPTWVQLVLNLFSNFAVISSFLAAGLDPI